MYVCTKHTSSPKISHGVDDCLCNFLSKGSSNPLNIPFLLTSSGRSRTVYYSGVCIAGNRSCIRMWWCFWKFQWFHRHNLWPWKLCGTKIQSWWGSCLSPYIQVKQPSWLTQTIIVSSCNYKLGNAETQVLHGLVKRWLEELKDDKEEALQAVFVFRVPIISTVNQISCSMYASANHIIDGFPSCQVKQFIRVTYY